MLDDDDWEPPPYRPLHPWREATTMIMAALLVAAVVIYGVWWLWSAVVGLFNGY